MKLRHLISCFKGLQDLKTERPVKAKRTRFKEWYLGLSGLELPSLSITTHNSCWGSGCNDEMNSCQENGEGQFHKCGILFKMRKSFKKVITHLQGWRQNITNISEMSIIKVNNLTGLAFFQITN